jgi:hypothetical protein
MKTTSKIAIASIALVLTFLAIGANASDIIWSGPTITFSKATGVDGTLPANQDDLTLQVILARGDIQGLYNAATESSFTHFLSPADTEWGDGTTADIGSITFTDWNTWYQDNGKNTGIINLPAVVHLESDDIYLNLTFTSWTTGHVGSNPGYSYTRSTPAPEPSTLVLLAVATIGLLGYTWRRRK